MKTLLSHSTARGSRTRRAGRVAVAMCPLVALILLSSSGIGAAGPAQSFATPQELVGSLDQAVNTTNRAAFALLFGTDSDWLANPDSVQGARELAEFSAAFNATNQLVRQSDTRMILQVGSNAWPFPIPIVKTASGWAFDTEAGREEILNRRIGRDEIAVLQAMRGYVDAQREYASRDRDGDEVLEYAQKIASSPGRMDGLYWPTELNGEVSPLGPLIAHAQTEGYFPEPLAPSTQPRPFQGYFFKILKSQGKHAPGGKYQYVINGHMIGGFAMVAWPAAYGETGVMSFIVNQQGRVYQKDLGERTARMAARMKAYDPDPSWKVSPD